MKIFCIFQCLLDEDKEQQVEKGSVALHHRHHTGQLPDAPSGHQPRRLWAEQAP